MNNKLYTFLLALMVILFAYMYATNKMIVFNHSGKRLEKLTVDSEFSHKELINIQAGEIMKFTFFSPFSKRVKIQIRQSGKISNTTFSLSGFFLGEKYNQVEIGIDGEMEAGILGIEK